VGLNDVGLHWDNIPTHHQWQERSRNNLPPHKSKFAYNQHGIMDSQVQWGDTGLLLMEEATHRTQGPMGTDPENLGRWTWAKIQGREGHIVRIVAAYKPCKNQQNEGSSYQQQLLYFRSRENFTCPLKLFDTHLKHQLQEWLSQGEQIVLGIDMNEDNRTGNTAKMLKDIGMIDAILKLHRPDRPPETNYKNGQGIPIDAIFTTPGISPTQGGYMPYKAFMDSDHRALWLDVPFTSFLGHNFPHMFQHKPSTVNPKDPRSVRKFNIWVHRSFQKQDNQIFKDLDRLQQMRTDQSPLESVIALHASIIQENNKTRLWAAKKTRRIFLGKYAWSPEWKKAKTPMIFWSLVLKRKQGGKVKSDYLQRLQNQTEVDQWKNLSVSEIQSKLTAAKAKFDLDCVRSSLLRIQFLDRLAEDLAIKNGTTKEVELKKLNNISKQKRRANRI
jgi:hypothetical protein